MSFRYGREPVLQNVSFDIFKGDFVSIIGPNGGGKTTLAKLILGLIHPSSGSVTVIDSSDGGKKFPIGYVAQHTHFDPYFSIPVEDVVAMGLLGPGPVLFSKFLTHAVTDALRVVECENIRTRCFTELSGGQRQRVLIARAIATKPDILILDEPTANVDHVAEDKFYKFLKELSRELTILLITHDIGFASSAVTKVICVNKSASIHPTCELTPKILKGYYGSDIEIVLHNKHE
jgi:zinc transport system ATP-binding protein